MGFVHTENSCLPRPHGFLVLGMPGAGKATLAAKMADKMGVVHVGFNQTLSDALAADELRLMLEYAETELQVRSQFQYVLSCLFHSVSWRPSSD